MEVEIKNLELTKLLGEQVAQVLISTMKETLNEHLEKQSFKEYLSITEACKYIDVSFNTFKNFRQMGLPVIEINGVKKVKKEDIDIFMDQFKY